MCLQKSLKALSGIGIVTLLFAVITQSGQADVTGSKADVAAIVIKDAIVCARKDHGEFRTRLVAALRNCLPQVEPNVVINHHEPLTFICRLNDGQKQYIRDCLSPDDRRTIILLNLGEFFSNNNLCYGLQFYCKKLNWILAPKNGDQTTVKFFNDHKEFLGELQRCVVDRVGVFPFRDRLSKAPILIKDSKSRAKMEELLNEVLNRNKITLYNLVSKRLSVVN